MSTQQLVVLSPDPRSGDELPPLGNIGEILDQLSHLNVHPEQEGDPVVYGPGIRIEGSPGEPIRQMLLTIVEEEIAWLVIMRVAKAMNWKLFDPTTGRELSP